LIYVIIGVIPLNIISHFYPVVVAMGLFYTRITMTSSICIGIIGNYFGHLSGAENVQEHPLPNGIFVIHRDHDETITTRPHAKYPKMGSNVDIEPEFVIRFKMSYANGKVVNLHPLQITIGNDFTIRQLEGSEKISQRKSWGEMSKGINQLWWDMQEFTPERYGKNLKLVSYIERDGELHCATPVADCSETKVFCSDLISWMVEQMNSQKDEGMYEAILPSIIDNNYPEELVLYTGAPNYSEWGQENFIKRGDKVHIGAYDSSYWDEEQLQDLFKTGKSLNKNQVMTFTQEII